MFARVDACRALQEAVYWSLEPALFKGRDVIIKRHSRTRSIFFLIHGSVVATNVTGDVAEANVFENVLYPLQDVGTFFGEQCLLRMTSRALVAYVAANPVTCLSMEASALVDAAHAHLDAKEREALAEQIWSEFCAKEQRQLWGSRILIGDLIEKGNRMEERLKSLKHRERADLAEEIEQHRDLIAVRVIQKHNLRRVLRERAARSVEQMLPQLLGARDRSGAGAVLGKVHFQDPPPGGAHLPQTHAAIHALKRTLDEHGKQLGALARVEAKLDKLLAHVGADERN